MEAVMRTAVRRALFVLFALVLCGGECLCEKTEQTPVVFNPSKTVDVVGPHGLTGVLHFRCKKDDADVEVRENCTAQWRPCKSDNATEVAQCNVFKEICRSVKEEGEDGEGDEDEEDDGCGDEKTFKSSLIRDLTGDSPDTEKGKKQGGSPEPPTGEGKSAATSQSSAQTPTPSGASSGEGSAQSPPTSNSPFTSQDSAQPPPTSNSPFTSQDSAQPPPTSNSPSTSQDSAQSPPTSNSPSTRESAEQARKNPVKVNNTSDGGFFAPVWGRVMLSLLFGMMICYTFN